MNPTSHAGKGQMRMFRRRLAGLAKDDSGQSLVFGVLSVFVLLFFGAMVMGVGRVTARRIQMQFAADAAASSAALVESECLNGMALLNTGMAQVRARALRYAADVNAYGVLAELRDQALKLNERLDEALRQQITALDALIADEQDAGRRAELDKQLQRLRAQLGSLYQDFNPFLPLLDSTSETFWTQQLTVLNSQLSAETDPEERRALQEQIQYAERMLEGLQVPEGSDPTWLQDIVGLDRTDLQYAQSYQRAEQWIPAGNQWLQEMSRLEYTIAILAPYLSAETAYRMAQENGAQYASVFPCSRWLPRDEAYLTVDVYHPGKEWWRVEGGDTELEVRALQCAACPGWPPCGKCTKCWLVSWTRGLSQQGMYRVCQLEDRRWYAANLLGGDEACIQQHEEFHVVTWGPEGVDVVVHDEYDPHWLEIINTQGTWPHNTIFVRNLDGVVQYAHYKWDAKTKEWVMPTEADFVALPPAVVTIDGVRVTVSIDPIIPLPGSALIRVLVPPYIALLDPAGQEWGRAYLGDTTWFTATINTVGVEVRDEAILLSKRGVDLRTEDADGRWRVNFDRDEEYWWQQRLTELEPDAHWHYEYMEFGARLEPERNAARLLAHRDVDTADLPDDEFATPACLPAWAYDGEMNPDGWLDASSGKLQLVSGAASGNDYAFYQDRPCWDPRDTGWGTRPPDGQWEFDYDGDGRVDETQVCQTCQGRGYVLAEPDDVFGRRGLPKRDDQHPPTLSKDPKDYQETNFKPDHIPLVLSEEFFKYGITAGVWHPSETHFPRTQSPSTSNLPERPVEYLLHDPYPGMKGLLRGPANTTARQRGELLRPAWGYLAVAAARPRLNRPGEQADSGGLNGGLYFADTQERQRWVEENLNCLYLKSCAEGWSYWDSRLIALSRQVLDEDVILGLDEPAETGVGWLMKRIAQGSPGGLVPSEQRDLPPGYDRYGYVSGWVSSIYGDYDPDYPPLHVYRDLSERVRPRMPYPQFGPPYLDSEGLLRDPLVDYLSQRQQGQRPEGGQLDYNRLDQDAVLH